MSVSCEARQGRRAFRSGTGGRGRPTAAPVRFALPALAALLVLLAPSATATVGPPAWTAPFSGLTVTGTPLTSALGCDTETSTDLSLHLKTGDADGASYVSATACTSAGTGSSYSDYQDKVTFYLKRFTGQSGSLKIALKWTENAILKTDFSGTLCNNKQAATAQVSIGVQAFYVNLTSSVNPIAGATWGQKLFIHSAKHDTLNLDHPHTVSWGVTMASGAYYTIGAVVEVDLAVSVDNPSASQTGGCLGYASVYPITGSTLLTFDSIVLV